MHLTAPVRIGIIGAGSLVGTRHLPNLKKHPNATVVAICRRNQEWLRRIADDFGVPGRYADYRAMLDTETLDAVVVASPAGLHYEHARAALERGLHVFVEKPMVLDPAHGEELVRLARERERLLVVGFDRRTHAHYRYARTLAQDGELGEVRQVVAYQALGLMPALRGEPGDRPVPRMRGTHSDPALAGGGILINTGSHLLDGIAWIAGQPLVEVSCRTVCDELPVETRAVVMGRLRQGALVSLAFEANAPGDWSWDERLTIYGSRGSLSMVWPAGPHALPERKAMDGTTIEVTPADLPPGSNAMTAFVEALLGHDAPPATGEDGLEATRVVTACYRSAETGEAQRLA